MKTRQIHLVHFITLCRDFQRHGNKSAVFCSSLGTQSVKSQLQTTKTLPAFNLPVTRAKYLFFKLHAFWGREKKLKNQQDVLFLLEGKDSVQTFEEHYKANREKSRQERNWSPGKDTRRNVIKRMTKLKRTRRWSQRDEKCWIYSEKCREWKAR